MTDSLCLLQESKKHQNSVFGGNNRFDAGNIEW